MRAAVINNEACTLIGRDCYEDAIKHLDKGLRALHEVSGNSNQTEQQQCSAAIRTSSTEATPHYYQNDVFDEGMTTFAQPALVCEESSDYEHRVTAKAAIFFNMGIAHSRKGDELQTRACLHKSFAIQYHRKVSSQCADPSENNPIHNHHGPSLCAILHNIGHSYWRSGEYAEAVSSYENALDLLTNHHAERYHLKISSTLNCIAVAKYYASTRSGKEDSAANDEILAIFTHALALRLSVVNSFDRETATIMNNTGRVRLSRGEFSAALMVFEKAHSRRVAALGENHVDVAATLSNMAQTKEYQGHISQAIDLYKQYLSIFLLQKGDGSREVANVLIVIGQLLYRSNELNQAYDFFLQALDAAKFAFGPRNSSVANTINKIGNVLSKQGKLELALESYQSELALERAIYPPLHKHISVTLLNIAHIYQKQKKWNDALGFYVEAINITRHNNNSKATVSILLDISLVHEMRGNFDLAATALSEAIDLSRALQDGDNPLASTLNTLGVIHTKAGALQPALASFLEALHILRSMKVRNIHQFISVCVNAADVYKRIGEVDQALELYKEALHLQQMESSNDQDGAPTKHKDMAYLSYHIGQILKERKNFDEALHFINLSSKICLENPTVIDSASAFGILTSLGDLYMELGHKDKARDSYAAAAHSLLCGTNPPGAAAA